MMYAPAEKRAFTKQLQTAPLLGPQNLKKKTPG